MAKHGPAGLASVELPCKMDLQKNILQEGQHSKNGQERSDRIFELHREKRAFLVMPQRKFLHRFSAGLSKGSFKHMLYRGPGPLAIR